jgi:cell shape-determining protein MreC
MPQGFFTPNRVLLMLVLMLLISSLLPSGVLRALTGTPRHVVEHITMPITHQLKRVSDMLRPAPPSEVEQVAIEDLALLRAINEELQQKIDELYQLLAQAEATQDFMREYSLRGFRRQTAAVTRGAADRARPVLLINRGAQDGIEIGQAVCVDGAQVVGRVSDVGPVASSVTLITQPAKVLEVVIRAAAPSDRPHRVGTTIEWDSRAGRFTTAILKDIPVMEGDLVHLADVDWPEEARGFVIGRVTAIEDFPDDPTLRQQIHIEPTRPLHRVRYVTVLVPTHAGDHPR